MNGDPAIIFDLLVNGLALVAAAAAIFGLPAGRDAAPVARRLRALLVAIALLLALRMINWSWPSALLAIPVTIIAATLPLLALRLAEQLLRRHAAALLKQVALGGTVALAVAAIVAGALFPRALMIALGVYQAMLLLWIVAFLARARHHELAPAERQQADTFALVLLLAVPFAASDFDGFGLPLRLGAIGVLLFVLATTRVAAGRGSPGALLADAAAFLLFGAVAARGAGALAPALTSADLWRIGALAVALAALLQVTIALRDLGWSERRRPSLLARWSALPDSTTADALVASHPVTAAGQLLEASGLALYDAQAVAALAEHRLVSSTTPLAPLPLETARDLLASHAATHLVRLSRAPPRFLAVNAGQVGNGGAIELELDVLARLADRGGA